MAGQWMRRGLALIVLAVVMVTAAPMQTRAQRADDLAALNKRISELYSAGKFDEAIPLAEKSLELTRTQMGADHFDTAARMGWLASLYLNQGRYPELWNEAQHHYLPKPFRSLCVLLRALSDDQITV